MTYATEIVQNYRLALRTLWNIHFWNEGFRNTENIYDFLPVQPSLFRGLVTSRLEPSAERSETIFGSAYRVVPPLGGGTIPTMFVKRKPVGFEDTNWEILAGPFTEKQIKLTLVDFFDWNTRTWRDFRYFLVKIVEVENRPELAGGEGLVDVLDVDVVFGV